MAWKVLSDPRYGLALSLLGALYSLGLGAWLLYVGVSQLHAGCNAAPGLAAAALTLGSIYGARGLLGIAAGAVAYKHDVARKGERPQTLQQWLRKEEDSSFATRALDASQEVLGLGLLGVLLWATVILFASSLWERMRSSTGAAQSGMCAPALYFPVAITVIALWSVSALILLMIIILAIALLDAVRRARNADPGTPDHTAAGTLAALLMLMGMRTLARRCSDSGRRKKKGGRRGEDSDAEGETFLNGSGSGSRV